jgi:truncated hemoglobin YjbI
LLLACLLAVTAGAGRAAEEANAPLDRKALDGLIYHNLGGIINRGADLYNGNQDYAGCYRLYEGALMALKPLLDHRPELQKAITTGIASAERQPVMHRRAHVLRAVIDRIRTDVRPREKEPVAKAKTLWDRLGGEAGVKKIVDDLVAVAGKDAKVDFFRGGKYKPTPEEVDDLKKKVVDYISSQTGGPYKYEGKSMKEVHKGMGITDAQFDAFARDFQVALEKNKVQPDDVQVLLDAVESTRKDIVEKKPKEKEPAAKALWDRLGGEAGVKKIVDDLVDVAGKDPKVDFSRGGKHKLTEDKVDELKKKVVAYISSKTGGPLPYEGKSMVEEHKGMGITDAQFDAFVKDFRDVLEKNKVAPADVKTLVDAVEGTRKDVVEKKPAERKPEDKKPKDKDGKKDAGAGSVRGVITVDGKPLEAGAITFRSVKGKDSLGAVVAQGEYELKEVDPGEYTVTVQSAEKGITLPKRYSDAATSGLTVAVQEGRNAVNFELKR